MFFVFVGYLAALCGGLLVVGLTLSIPWTYIMFMLVCAVCLGQKLMKRNRLVAVS